MYMGKYFFAFPHILGGPSSCVTLQLLHSGFPCVLGKFDFLFYQCMSLGGGGIGGLIWVAMGGAQQSDGSFSSHQLANFSSK
jgi:hypothetical protein